MRIISGEYKGRVISAPKVAGVRPTPDRVRENVFNILQNRIAGARVLDLFAGTGLLGAEFLSRGALSVIFSDKLIECVRAINETLAAFHTAPDRYRVIRGDCFYVLRLLRGEKFDIIYIDPPYSDGLYGCVLETIFQNRMLPPGGLVAVEHPAKTRIQVPEGAAVADQRTYGTIGLSFFQSN